MNTWRILAGPLTAALWSLPVSARVVDKTTELDGVMIRYKLVLPRDYDPSKEYPAVLAFPPGSQNNDMVQTTVLRNWSVEGERRGYIVASPSSPGGELFFREGARIFPAFLEHLLREYKIRDNKFHVAGMSNGGLSAFHIAALYPKYFWSVTGFPGYLPQATPARVEALTGLCVNMYVGELDSGWLQAMQDQAAELRARGFMVRFSVERGQGHVMSTLTGAGSARLYDSIEAGCAKK